MQNISYEKMYVDEYGSGAHTLYEKLKKQEELPAIYKREELFEEIKENCFADTLPIGQAQISDEEDRVNSDLSFKERILASFPLYYLQDKTPQARVAMFYYGALPERDDVYLLLVQEAEDSFHPFKSKAYSDLGGAVKLKENRPETFLEAALRLGGEPSFFLGTAETVIKKSHLYFRHSLNERQICVLFTPVLLDLLSTPLKRIKENCTLPYQWIGVKSLLSTLQSSLNTSKKESTLGIEKNIFLKPVGPLATLEGQHISLKIRPFILELLKDESFLKILKLLKK